jgi:hypothetical protein
MVSGTAWARPVDWHVRWRDPEEATGDHARERPRAEEAVPVDLPAVALHPAQFHRRQQRCQPRPGIGDLSPPDLAVTPRQPLHSSPAREGQRRLAVCARSHEYQAARPSPRVAEMGRISMSGLIRLTKPRQRSMSNAR